MENLADDSAIKAASDRQRRPTAVGRNGNYWGGNAHCLRECDEFISGEGRSAATGVGGAHGTRGRSDENRTRTSSGKRNARDYGGIRGRWLSVRGRAIPHRDWALESASLKRNHDGCASAGIRLCPFDAVWFVIWIDSGSEIRRTTHRFGSPERRANDQCEPGAASGAESTGGWAGGDGDGALDECWPDDSDIRSVARGRSGIRGSTAYAGDTNFDPGIADRRAGTSDENTKRYPRQAGGD